MASNTTEWPMNVTVFDFGFNDTNDGNDSLLNATTQMMQQTRKPYPYNGRFMIDNAREFNKIYNYLAYALGIPGNIFAIVLLARLKPKNSTAIWLIAMTSCDLLSLTVRCIMFPLSYYIVFKYDQISCVFESIVTLTTEHCAYVFLLAMTTERFIAVWFPLKMAVWCTPTRATIGAITIFIVLMLSDFHYIETLIPYTQEGVYTDCFYKREYQEFWEYTYLDKIQAITFRLIPLFSIILFNILIVVRLGKSRQIQKKMSDEQLKEKQKQQRQINRLLTLATTFFFISVALDLALRLFKSYFGNPRRDWYAARAILICENASAALRVGNHAGNFYLYVIAARKFRLEFFHLVTFGRYGEHNGVKGTQTKKMSS